MTTSVDDIIIANQTTTADKLDSIIGNLKEKTDDTPDADSEENSSHDDDQASASTDSGRKDKNERKERNKRNEETESDSDSSTDDYGTEEDRSDRAADQEASDKKGNKKSRDSAAESTAEGDEGEHEETDDYGQPVGKASEKNSAPDRSDVENKEKLYSGEDVSRMIRERLERIKPEHKDVMQDRLDNFTPDPNSQDDWQVQLKDFVRETFKEIKDAEANLERERIYKQQKIEDQKIQAEFENRFTEGMNKRPDWQKVASKMPIKDSMMLAMRKFKDPAGFIYAAAKQRPDDLHRIAGLSDPLEQASELGRLEESMKRQAKKASSAPKIINRAKGDMSQRERPRQSPDDIIMNEQKKIKR